MLKMTNDDALELRGIANRVSAKSKKPYYLIRLETVEGEPVEFVCRNADALPPGLKKGDTVFCTFAYNFRFRELELVSLYAANAVQ